MKRFKNISNLSDINTGDKAFTLSPKTVYSQTAPHTSPHGIILPSPPPLPTSSSVFKGIHLPEEFVERVRDAIKIANGHVQSDEINVAKNSGLLAAAGFALNSLPKLSFLGPEWSKIGYFVGISQLASVATSLMKPSLRKWFGVWPSGLDELKNINTKQYEINIYPVLKDPVTNSSTFGPKESTSNLTLKSIADLMAKSKELVTDHWVVGSKAYTFANQDDVNKIATMLDRNDISNKIDDKITKALPFIAFAVPVAYIQSNINRAAKESENLGNQVKNENPGVYTKPTPQQIKDMQAAKEQYLKEQKQQLGPKTR